MAGHASQNIDKATLWGGKVSPFGTSYGKMMMWFFLVSDALTFGGLLTAFGFIRHSYVGEWPVGEEVFHHFPLAGETHMPLIYVAFMTFILIVSSVTMVLAVEAGHRNDRKGVTKWMIWTVIGGFIFLGSQVWEWSHFIHGSHFGKVQLEDGSFVHAEGEYGKINKLVAYDGHNHHLKPIDGWSSEYYMVNNLPALMDLSSDHESHDMHAGHGHGHDDHSVITGGHADHMYREALSAGHLIPGKFLLSYTENEEEKEDTVQLLSHDGHFYAMYKADDKIAKLIVKEAGSHYALKQEIEGDTAQLVYNEALNSGEARRVIFGAHLKDNEYGPPQYGQFFFFITGFHGFHVFSGVMINLIILLQVLGGVMERRGHYEMVEKVGLYWHFVDLVWVFVFTFFYLI